MKLGISTYTYNWAIGMSGYPAPKHPMTATMLLERATDLGAEVVQFCNGIPLHTFSDDDLTRLRAEAESRGLVIELGTAGVEPYRLRQYIAVAQRVGATFIRTLTHSPEMDPTIEEAAGLLAEVLPDLKSSGVTIGIENHDKHTCPELIELVERVGDEHVGICLDTGNNLGALETTQMVLDALLPYTVNVHYKDFSIARVPNQMGFEVTGAIAGQGTVDAAAVFDGVASLDREVNVILEMWHPYLGDVETSITNEDDWARKSFSFLLQQRTTNKSYMAPKGGVTSAYDPSLNRQTHS